MKRILSMLLCLALVIGFIPVFTMPAQAASGTFVKVTSAPSDWSGTYLIVYETGKLAFNGGLSTLDVASNTVAVTISNGEIAATTALLNATFTIAKSGSNYTIQSKSGKYIGRTSNSNELDESTSTKYTNTITLNSDGSAHIVGSGSAVLRYNATSGQTRFRYYKSSSYSGQKAIHLYKYVENTCAHTDWVWATDANSHYKLCNGCNEKMAVCTKAITYEQTSETQHTPTCDCGYSGTAVNHEFGEYTPVDGGHNRVCDICDYAEATAPCEDNGTGTCGTCGTDMGCPHEWKDAYNETQHYQVCSLCGGTKGEEDHELAKTYTDTTHTSGCDCGYSVTEKHVLTNGACSDCDFAMKSEVTGGYVLVTDASTLKAGDRVVIVAKDSAYALSTEQKDNNRGQASVTKSGNTVTFGNDVQILTLETGSVTGTFAFNAGAKGYLYAAGSASSGNYLRTKTQLDNSGSWRIEITDGVALIVAQGSAKSQTMQYNQSSSLFACYASASQKAICIYKYVANDTEVNVFQADTRLKDTLNLAFHFTADTEDAIVKAGALIRIGDETYNYIATAGTGYYSVEVSGIYAQSIDTVVYIKPYVELADGLVYGTEKSTSVLSCLEYMYGNDKESEATKLVIKDLLNYANAARNYFVAKGTMSAPAQAFNNVLAEADRVLAWNEAFRADLAEVEETTGAFVPENGTVIAGIQEALRLRVEFADTNVAGFVYWNADEYAANSGNHTIATGTQTFVMDGGVAKGYIENIYAYEMYENFYIRAYNAEGELSKTYTRSIAAYITIEMDDNAGDEAYVELCKAMLIYGNTAKESDAIVKG